MKKSKIFMPCGHCGSNLGYYETYKAKGVVVTFYDEFGDTEEMDNGGMYDSVDLGKTFETRCASCHEKLDRRYEGGVRRSNR